MLTSELFQLMVIKRSVIPQPLHFFFKTLRIKRPQNIHQVIDLLFVLRSRKRFKYHHLRLIHRIN